MLTVLNNLLTYHCWLYKNNNLPFIQFIHTIPRYCFYRINNIIYYNYSENITSQETIYILDSKVFYDDCKQLFYINNNTYYSNISSDNITDVFELNFNSVLNIKPELICGYVNNGKYYISPSYIYYNYEISNNVNSTNIYTIFNDTLKRFLKLTKL